MSRARIRAEIVDTYATANQTYRDRIDAFQLEHEADWCTLLEAHYNLRAVKLTRYPRDRALKAAIERARRAVEEAVTQMSISRQPKWDQWRERNDGGD